MHWRDIHPKVIKSFLFLDSLKSESIRYLLVGAVTAVLYLGAIVLFIEVLNLEYRLSVSIAYFVAVSFHFLANRIFTFASEKGQIKIQFFRYLFILLVNIAITLASVFFMVDILQISHYIAAFFALALTIVVGYLASKFWIFN